MVAFVTTSHIGTTDNFFNNTKAVTNPQVQYTSPLGKTASPIDEMNKIKDDNLGSTPKGSEGKKLDTNNLASKVPENFDVDAEMAKLNQKYGSVGSDGTSCASVAKLNQQYGSVGSDGTSCASVANASPTGYASTSSPTTAA